MSDEHLFVDTMSRAMISGQAKSSFAPLFAPNAPLFVSAVSGQYFVLLLAFLIKGEDLGWRMTPSGDGSRTNDSRDL